MILEDLENELYRKQEKIDPIGSFKNVWFWRQGIMDDTGRNYKTDANVSWMRWMIHEGGEHECYCNF